MKRWFTLMFICDCNQRRTSNVFWHLSETTQSPGLLCHFIKWAERKVSIRQHSDSKPLFYRILLLYPPSKKISWLSSEVMAPDQLSETPTKISALPVLHYWLNSMMLPASTARHVLCNNEGYWGETVQKLWQTQFSSWDQQNISNSDLDSDSETWFRHWHIIICDKHLALHLCRNSPKWNAPQSATHLIKLKLIMTKVHRILQP